MSSGILRTSSKRCPELNLVPLAKYRPRSEMFKHSTFCSGIADSQGRTLTGIWSATRSALRRSAIGVEDSSCCIGETAGGEDEDSTIADECNHLLHVCRMHYRLPRIESHAKIKYSFWGVSNPGSFLWRGCGRRRRHLNGAEAAPVLKSTQPETPIILFTMYTDLHADSLSAFCGVDFISKVDGIPKLLERVDALLPPTANGEDTLW